MAEPRLKTGKLEAAQTGKPAVNPEEVAKLAYEIYLKRGGAHGNDLGDWFEAEAQLRKN